MDGLWELIVKCVREKFYGELTIKFTAGKIEKVNKNEQLDPKQFAMN